MPEKIDEDSNTIKAAFTRKIMCMFFSLIIADAVWRVTDPPWHNQHSKQLKESVSKHYYCSSCKSCTQWVKIYFKISAILGKFQLRIKSIFLKHISLNGVLPCRDLKKKQFQETLNLDFEVIVQFFWNILTLLAHCGMVSYKLDRYILSLLTDVTSQQ